MTKASGRPDVGEELVDFRAQDVGFLAQRAGRAQHLAGRRSGLSRGGADTDDVAGNLRGAAGGVLDVAVAFAVWLARLFTSEATTAKPLPASPARAASMVALSASRLVCEAMV